MKEDRSKESYILWFYIYEISTISESMESGQIDGLWRPEREKHGKYCLMNMGFSTGVMKMIRTK